MRGSMKIELNEYEGTKVYGYVVEGPIVASSL